MAPTPKSTAAKAAAKTPAKTPAGKAAAAKTTRPRAARAKPAPANARLLAPETEPRALIAARLEALACDPVTIIARIALDETADARLRFAAAKELAALMLARPRRTANEAAGTSVDIGAIIARAWAAGGGS